MGVGLIDARRAWLPEALLLIAAAVVVAGAFASPTLDLESARVFFRPNLADRWPFARDMPWSMLYDAAPWITAALIIGGLVVLAAGFLRQQIAWRRHATFVILSVVVGPGLLINAVFKDHWDRPRPREIAEFGGPLQYVPAPLPGKESGASFPCGHCSVGFMYGAGWWIWRKRKPWVARASLAVGIVAGLSLGIGRIAAGGHFLSDVVWSAILAFGVCHVVYFHTLRLHRYDWSDTPAASNAVPPVPDRWHHVTAAVVALGGIGVLAALFVAPHGTLVDTKIPTSSLAGVPRVVVFMAHSVDVDVVVVDSPAAEISVVGELHGFGLPTSRLRASYSFRPERGPALFYRIEQKGWFTDLNGAVTVMLPAARLERLVVHLRRGNIQIRDQTSLQLVANGNVRLDLQTHDGHIEAPHMRHAFFQRSIDGDDRRNALITAVTPTTRSVLASQRACECAGLPTAPRQLTFRSLSCLIRTNPRFIAGRQAVDVGGRPVQCALRPSVPPRSSRRPGGSRAA